MSEPPTPDRPATRLTSYHRRLFALLTLATFFEGFDTALAQLVLPLLGREFGVGRDELGFALAVAGLGMWLAFLAIRAADRFGRRPLMLVSVVAFAAFTLATALASDLRMFAALQLGARLFLVTELALAYVMLSEELPAQVRGRANGLLGGLVSVGAAVPMLLLAPLEEMGWGWRGLFALGAVPLLLWPVYWRVLREPAAFVEQREHTPAPPMREELREWVRVLAPGLRRRFLGASALWWTVNFWTGSTLYFFTHFAFEERGWTPEHVASLPWGMVPCGIAGYVGAGWAMDRIGRRPTATAYLVGATGATWICFAGDSDWTLYVGYFAMYGAGGLWTVAATVTTELFPTDLRATANAFAGSVVGRTGIVLGPAVCGALAEGLGSTAVAVCALSLVNLLCIPVVWRALPETRGIPLDHEGG